MARRYSIETQTGDGVTETIIVDRADSLAEAFQKALSLSEPGSSVSAYEDIGEATTPSTSIGDRARDTAPGGPLYTPTILDISDEDTVLNPQTARIIERMIDNRKSFSVYENFSVGGRDGAGLQRRFEDGDGAVITAYVRGNRANPNQPILIEDVVNTYRDELTSRLEQAGANQTEINTQLGLFNNFTAKIEAYRNQPETLTRFLDTALNAKQ